GMGGHTVPVVLDGLPLTVVPLYFELDGSFPNHEANPLDPANLVDLQAAVREHGADLGLAFDGDADRVFVVDERGEPVSPSEITAAYRRYVASGEINSTVDDAKARTADVRTAFEDEDGARFDELDGLTVSLPDGAWFNLRASNTEPLLRLNVEAPDAQRMSEL